MKQKIKSFFYVLLICQFIACKEIETTPQRINGYEPVLRERQDSLEHDVLEGHDQAMARFAKLSKNTHKIQLLIDSLSTTASSKQNSTFIASLKIAANQLDEAKISMNDWMDGFKLDSLRNDKEARINYLESELLKVNVMKQKIVDALAKSDSLLNK